MANDYQRAFLYTALVTQYVKLDPKTA